MRDVLRCFARQAAQPDGGKAERAALRIKGASRGRVLLGVQALEQHAQLRNLAAHHAVQLLVHLRAHAYARASANGLGRGR